MNNTLLSNALMFAAGAAVGSAVAWIFAKKRFEKIANEEIESVKRVFCKREEKVEDDLTEEVVEEAEPVLNEVTQERVNYQKIINNADYNTATKNEEEGDEDVEYYVEPYVISPDEFGELAEDGYDTVSFYLYSNGILEDSITKDLIDDEDIDRLIGRGSLNTFGRYEEDSVFVRNENNCIDYEILRVDEAYGG